ncbi:MAG: tetratricopeptide repeat protein [Elusimicrobia bacterium]|nr:tetratricopeptide repeat protein [Elusimicrobiota bacterium]
MTDNLPYNGNPVEKGRVLLSEDRPGEALKILRAAAGKDPDNAEIRLLMARTYLKLGETEDSRACYLLAEEELRRNIKSDPLNLRYHDLLIETKRRLGSLHELSAEYRRKLEKEKNGIYENLLKKISAISILSIPAREKSARRRGRFSTAVKYIIMPSVAATGFVGLMMKVRALWMPVFTVLAAYFAVGSYMYLSRGRQK